MNSIIKKLSAAAVIAALLVIGAGCGKKDDDNTEPQKPQTSVQSDEAKEQDTKEEETETEKPAEEPAEEQKKEEAPVEAPVIESADELEGMVNEFNETDDPERKEELRKQLEAILSQAEAMTAE